MGTIDQCGDPLKLSCSTSEDCIEEGNRTVDVADYQRSSELNDSPDLFIAAELLSEKVHIF